MYVYVWCVRCVVVLCVLLLVCGVVWCCVVLCGCGVVCVVVVVCVVCCCGCICCVVLCGVVRLGMRKTPLCADAKRLRVCVQDASVCTGTAHTEAF